MFHGRRLCVFPNRDTRGLTCGSAVQTEIGPRQHVLTFSSACEEGRNHADRSPGFPGPPGSPGPLQWTALDPLACRYFLKRTDFISFSSVYNGINMQGKLIMHRPDWVFAFNNVNFKLNGAQIGQFRKRLMGSYCNFSLYRESKMHLTEELL